MELLNKIQNFRLSLKLASPMNRSINLNLCLIASTEKYHLLTEKHPLHLVSSFTRAVHWILCTSQDLILVIACNDNCTEWISVSSECYPKPMCPLNLAGVWFWGAYLEGRRWIGFPSPFVLGLIIHTVLILPGLIVRNLGFCLATRSARVFLGGGS